MNENLSQYGIEITSVGMFESYKQGVWQPPPVLRDYDLLIFTSGTGTWTLNGKQQIVSARDVVLLRRGDIIEEAFSAGRIDNMFVHFEFRGANGMPVDPPEEILPPRLCSHANYNVVTCLIQLATQVQAKGDADLKPEETCTLLRAVLILLTRHGERPVKMFPGEHRSRMIGDIAQRILTDPAPHRSVPELAKEAGISTPQFTRYFRKLTGQPPGDFMISARLERARLLLSCTSRTLVDIADELGYVDVYYFTRQFAARVGCPPGEFREHGAPASRRPAKSTSIQRT